MEHLRLEYNRFLRDRNFLLSFLLGAGALLSSLWVNYYAGSYATREISNSVTDLILSNTRTYDLDGVFVYGAFAFCIIVFFICLLKPGRIPFLLKSFALFIIIRAAFITLTHIGPPQGALLLGTTGFITNFTFGGDLFFSGHTGLPFLTALIFWDVPLLRFFFIGMSIVFGIVVLLAHLHYSIDVASAFFITYTIYHLALRFFKKDHALFERTIDPSSPL